MEICVRAQELGTLPADGETVVGCVTLPAGNRLRPERYKIYGSNSFGELSKRLPHIGWFTDTAWGATADPWMELARAFTFTGLWPVVGGPGDRCAKPGPLDQEEPLSRDHGEEAANVLQRRWDGMALVDRTTGEPLPETREPFPGVTAGVVPVDSFESVPLAYSDHWGSGFSGSEAGILLVPATRPADVPQLVGWTGAGNYFMGGHEISAVLRSWEERFGAVLYQLGKTTLTLRVARPPMTLAEARVLAQEHYLLCHDNFGSQDWGPPISPEDYARRLVGAPAWDFWWD